MRKPRKFSGDTRQTSPLHTCGPAWGVSWSPPSAGPLQGLDGGVSALHGEQRPGPCPPTLPSPVLSWVRTYLAGPRARCGHRPRSSFPGSGRVPAAALQEPVPAPAPGPTNSAVPVTAAPNPRGRRWRSPAGPAPGAAASFRPRSRPGWGRRALLRVTRREDLPLPSSSPQVGGSGLGAVWGGGKPKSKSRPPTLA